MIDDACFCQIKHLHEQQGLSASQIAATLSLDPRTVAFWLTQERFRLRKPRRVPVNSIRSRPRWSGCWKNIPIPPPRSSSACVSKAMRRVFACQSLRAHRQAPASARLSHPRLCPR